MNEDERLLTEIIEKTKEKEIKWFQKTGISSKLDFKKHPYEASWDEKKLKIGTSGHIILLNIYNGDGSLELEGWGICKNLQSLVEALFDTIQRQKRLERIEEIRRRNRRVKKA